MSSLPARIAAAAEGVSTSAIVAPQSSSSIQQSSIAPLASTRWDWLENTQWYVPVENLLAYAAPQDLSNPTPIGDQTLWNITSSSNGHIEGLAVVDLSVSSSSSQLPFQGTVTEGGQIRIEFGHGQGQAPTTGVGQMRWLDGEWRMEMQMITGSSVLITHWAYQSQLDSNTLPPDPDNPPLDENLVTRDFSWLEGSRWAISENSLFGKGKTGVFTIDEYHNGYFWGSGTSKKPFNVLGSVTPEGNVIIAISVNGGTSSWRIGQIISNGAGGVMVLRTYVDKPATGFAWNIDGASSAAAAITRLTSTALETIRTEAAEVRLTAKQIKELTKELKDGFKAAVKLDTIRATARSNVRNILDRLAPWFSS